MLFNVHILTFFAIVVMFFIHVVNCVTIAHPRQMVFDSVIQKLLTRARLWQIAEEIVRLRQRYAVCIFQISQTCVCVCVCVCPPPSQATWKAYSPQEWTKERFNKLVDKLLSDR